MINKIVSAALSVVVTLGMAGMVSVSTVSAEDEVTPGNNGTFKVHEFGTPEMTEGNDPKAVCKFNFEAFDLDPNQTGTVTVLAQPGNAEADSASVSLTTDEDGNGATEYINSLSDGMYKATLDNKFGTDEGDKAKSKVFKVECEPVVVPPTPVPASAVTLVCPANKYTLTISNPGETVLDVVVNGSSSKLAIKSSTTADFNVGDTLSVKINGEFVNVQGKVLNNFKLPTCQGMGSTITTSGTTGTTTAGPVRVSSGFGSGAATDVASLPVTSGSSAQIATVVVMISSLLAAAGAYAARARSGMAL